MAKGIENQSRSPPSVFDFATSQIQKHGGTKMYYDLVESGKRIKALRKKHGLRSNFVSIMVSIGTGHGCPDSREGSYSIRIFRPTASIASVRICGIDKALPPIVYAPLAFS